MSNRPSELDILFEVASAWSKRSTCPRLRVGAVVALDGRILSHGYNGAPAGLPHCDHDVTEPCTRAVHAEANAVYYAARRGRATEGATLICTHQPCRTCAEAAVNAGISTVVYREPYRCDDGLVLLREAGVQVSRVMSPMSSSTSV